MKVLERWGTHLGVLGVGGTGLLYGYLKYFRPIQGEFGVEPHPWQGFWQHGHVLLAPLLVFAIGLVIRGHAWGMFRQRGRSGWRSGVGLAVLVLPMVFAGYGAQVAVGGVSRAVMVWMHGVAGCLFLFSYLVHLWVRPARHSAAP